MAVIINDFEVVVEPPRPEEGTQEGSATQAQAHASEPLSPLSLEMVLRQRLQRLCRVRAD